MRPRRAIGVLGTLALVTFATASASARECDNPLVNSCINSENYWPTAGPMRFATVAGTETLAPGQIGFGLVSSYVSRPIVLRIASPGPGGSDQYVVDDQVNGNFLFGYGVTERLQLDFALPVTFVQTGAGTSPITGGEDLRDTAVRDLRFGVAYALVPRDRVAPDAVGDARSAGKKWSLTARMGVAAPTGDSADFAGERSAVFAPGLAADYRYKALFFGAEVGARIRPVTEFAGARVGTQLVTAVGAGVDILDRERLSLMLEGRMYPNFIEQHKTSQSAFGITSTPNGKHILPAEWLLSVRTAPLLAGDVAFFLGGGGPIPLSEDGAITVPRFRFVLGIVYAPTGRDTDGDGVLDRNDACPNKAGPREGERPGCPVESAPPAESAVPAPAPAAPAPAPAAPAAPAPAPAAPAPAGPAHPPAAAMPAAPAPPPAAAAPAAPAPPPAAATPAAPVPSSAAPVPSSAAPAPSSAAPAPAPTAPAEQRKP